MKRNISIILAGLCLFSLCSCKKPVDKDPVETGTPNVTEREPVVKETDTPDVSQNKYEEKTLEPVIDLNCSFTVRISGLEPEEVTIIYPDGTEGGITYKNMDFINETDGFTLDFFNLQLGTYRIKYEKKNSSVSITSEVKPPVVLIDITEADAYHVAFSIMGLNELKGVYRVEAIRQDKEQDPVTVYSGEIKSKFIEASFDTSGLILGEYAFKVSLDYGYMSQNSSTFALSEPVFVFGREEVEPSQTDISEPEA